MTVQNKPNRLAEEKSPYLLQHAHNPVDWYPWSDQAFEKAARENKPVFLSVGYSTCHWCHNMARESFEDPEVGRLLNDHYVSVKVDREERPDVDHIYMNVCQALTGSGGWPLTVIMTPDKKPFFAGTYFPKENRYGQPGLMDILARIHEAWTRDRDGLLERGQEIIDAVQPHYAALGGGKLEPDILDQAFAGFKDRFDPVYGGFGGAPKFPSPHNLAFLLRYGRWKDDDEALAMVEKTLDGMHNGGLWDHLGFGFARYAVDHRWLVPHFEKMLYDNALLAMAYLEAYQVTDREQYARVARQIFAYIRRDMTAPGGGFYTAEDADSEGEEGKFYVWTPQEITAVLGEETGALFGAWYGVTEKGNFEGRNILHRIEAQSRSKKVLAQAPDWENRLEAAREKLFAAREKRIHPHKDDKILTGWNGLMIAALAQGFRVLQDRAYLKAAVRAADFIWEHLRTPEGRLLARHRKGESAFPAYIDDYAFLTWAMLELYQADLKPVWLERALSLQEDQNRLFWDADGGGYYFYGSDAEELIVRPKEVYDGATPSGNSVAALNLLRLGRLTNRPDYLSMAETMFETFSGNIGRYPAGHTHFLMALLFAATPGRQIVVASDRDHAAAQRELGGLHRVFAPDTVFLYRFRGDGAARLENLAPFTREMVPQQNKTTFYVCENFACRQPVTDISEVRQMLAPPV